MATRPMTAQRWPRNQEQRRQRTLESAEDAEKLLSEARKNLIRNPTLAELYIADAQRILETIQRDMVEAQFGVEAPEE